MPRLARIVAFTVIFIWASLAHAGGSYVSYDFTADFNKLPVGPYQITQQKKLWNDYHINNQRNRDLGPNLLFKIVSTPNGNALQAFYPKGSIGTSVGIPG